MKHVTRGSFPVSTILLIIAKYGSELDYRTAWEKLWQYSKQKDIVSENSELIGLRFDAPHITNHQQYRFDACISTNQAIKPEGEFGLQEIMPFEKYRNNPDKVKEVDLITEVYIPT